MIEYPRFLQVLLVLVLLDVPCRLGPGVVWRLVLGPLPAVVVLVLLLLQGCQSFFYNL